MTDPNGTDYAAPWYQQPQCVICGRFAARDKDGSWYFKCVTGGEHD